MAPHGLTTTRSTNASAEGRAWWTVAELAKHYGLSERTVYAAIERGDLTEHRFGGKRRGIRVADADRLEWEGRSREAQSARTTATTSRGPKPRPLVAKHFPH
ncbi:helix-turn-helix domain-containing protein [Botrimarina mediterranea]|uniref:Helix-turn-helix domain protein n=1 Tax=Botrimarina mediterranea TaxID=2528022 RepID=A0A518K232_9BACT|nr:helix-turn-helix domain-containing protein [Botrimarina mediterranea]QDV71866.1 Helix-turn-helix domain protein [Botrimarina mediterranea]